jgi:multidrug efflux system outer membrane protein
MKRTVNALGAVTLSLVLAACNMAPKYVRPELPVPATSPQGPAYAADAANAVVPADPAWRDFFTDARLARVIEMALANNRDLRIAVANVAQARAQYRVQRADLFPTVGATGTATYSEQPLVQFGQSQRLNTDVYQAQVGITAWEIDLFGRVRNLSKAAQEEYFASVENRNAAQTS